MPRRIWIGPEATATVGPWICQKTNGTWVPEVSSIIGLVDSDSGSIIAGVMFESFNGASIQMHVASVGKANWLSRAYLGFCFQYAFNQIGVKKVLGLVAESNSDARRFDEHLGFRLEATLSDAHPDGALLVYTMTAEQCRWLQVKVTEGDFYGRQSQDT